MGAAALAGALALSIGALLVDGPQAAVPGAQAAILVDGDFSGSSSGKQLRAEGKAPGWFESRRDKAAGRKRLMLSVKDVAGNTTPKAFIKGSAAYNTYLSQAFTQPQSGTLSLKWDILVKEVGPQYNRSAFQMIGDDSAKGKGPNATGTERFVFLAYENAATKGKLNLFAFEGGDGGLNKRTLVARDLDAGKWYTVRVDADVAGRSYKVTVSGTGTAAQSATVKAFAAKGKQPPSKLTHVSFASWNDGPGAFYVDNVGQP